jgi:hypothetical protein
MRVTNWRVFRIQWQQLIPANMCNYYIFKLGFLKIKKIDVDSKRIDESLVFVALKFLNIFSELIL